MKMIAKNVKMGLVIFIQLMVAISSVNAALISIGDLEDSIELLDPCSTGDTLSTNGIEFNADIQMGFIGVMADNKVDFPNDNIFRIDVTRPVKDTELVWMEYDVKGVHNSNSVALIINDNTAVGGQVISKQSKEWSTQRVRIHKSWLSHGINRFQFSKLENNTYAYAVRNVKLLLEDDFQPKTEIVINESSFTSFGNIQYVTGSVQEFGKELVDLSVNGESISVANYAFEAIVNLDNSNGTTVKAIFSDGSEITKNLEVRHQLEEAAIVSQLDVLESAVHNLISNHAFSLTNDDFAFTVEDSVLNYDIQLRATKLRYVDLPPLETDLKIATGKFSGLRLLPHGKHFSDQGAILKLPYAKDDIPKGYLAEDIKTFFYDIGEAKWVPLRRDSIDKVNGFIYSRVNHFTDYINGVIATPESAESTSFTSTTFQDLLKASPTAGITLINPPSASQTGEAGVSYPLAVPPGRNGMQPSLAVSYSSDAGSSWVGFGWNLQIPSIEVETKWGSPRYDAGLESESYLMAGSQLVTLDGSGAGNAYLPHRRSNSAWVPRIANREFYSRIEGPGGFTEHVRMGNSPSNYYWVVTDRHGTKYFYGGVNMADNNYRITTANGDIAKWLLARVEDTYGNGMTYTYDINRNVQLGTNYGDGVSCYIDRIDYTDHISSTPASQYSVQFSRSATPRKDPRIDARSGVVMVDDQKLERIDVLSANAGTVRSFNFNSITGLFEKTLLEELICNDASGTEFYRHNFDYFDDVASSGSFTAPENWDTGDATDVDRADFVIGANAAFGQDSEQMFSPLGGGVSEGTGFSFYLGVGTGFESGKQLTIGGSYSSSNSTSTGRVQLIDINGDGLPDKVSRQGNNVIYRLNTARNDAALLYDFGVTGSLVFSGINSLGNNFEFSESNDNTKNFGVNAYPPGGLSAGVNWNKSTSMTSAYFSDVNGDGFIDIVNNGLVNFNTTNSITNATVGFDLCSALSMCPLGTPTLDAGLYDITPVEIEESINTNPPIDVVKVWTAPRNGMLSIPSNVISCVASEVLPNGDVVNNVDGVEVMIQYNNETPMYTSLIPSGGVITTPIVPSFMISEGDRIYFRVKSGVDRQADGVADLVTWDASVEYDNTLGIPLLDASNSDYYNYNFNTDAIHSQVDAKTVANNMLIDFTADVLTTNPISDKIQLQMIVDGMVVDFKDITSNMESVSLSFTTIVDNSMVSFRLISNSVVNWQNVEVANRNLSIGTEMFSNTAVPVEYAVYKPISISPDFANTIVQVSNDLIVPSGTMNPYSSSFNIGVSSILPANGVFTLSVKDIDRTYFQETFSIDNTGSIISSSIEINEPIENLTNIYSTITMENQEFYDNPNLLVINQVILFNGTIGQNLIPTIYTFNAYDPYSLTNANRNWGIFGYNPDADVLVDGYARIEESELVDPFEGGVAADPTVTLDQNTNMNSPNGGFQVYEMVYFPMSSQVLNGTTNLVWQGPNENIYATQTTSHPSRLSEGNAVLTNPIAGMGAGGACTTGSNYPGITLESKTDGIAVNVAVASVLDLSSTVYAEGETVQRLAYQDLNGDRIPDIIGTTGISYSFANGELSPVSILSNPIGTSSTKNELVPVGLSVGGGYTHAFSKRNSTQANKISAAASISGGFSTNESRGATFWQDVNGDGLSDMIITDNSTYAVRINLGYDFTDEIVGLFDPNASGDINLSRSPSATLGIGFSIAQGSFSGGVGYSRTNGDGKSSYVDVNGDGLADFVYIDANNNMQLRLNTGSSFINYNAYNLNGLSDVVNKSRMHGSSINAALTIAFNILGVKIAITPGVVQSMSMNRVEAMFSDIDGDGYVDFLTSSSEVDLLGLPGTYNSPENINVRRSQIGRTHKLLNVTNSIGGTFDMDYALSGATVQHPGGKWVMQNLIVNDGTDDNGIASETRFEYANGYHDRCERMFLGFENVNTIQLQENPGTMVKEPYRTIANTYINDNIYRRGLMTESLLREGDAAGAIWQTTTNTYITELVSPEEGVNNNQHTKLTYIGTLSSTPEAIIFTALESTDTRLNVNGNIGDLATMTYDNLGNLDTYTYDNGSPAYTTEIEYFNNLPANILGVPSSLEIPGFRSKNSTINNQGKILQLNVNNGSSVATTDYVYNQYGNLDLVTLPESGGRMTYDYTYEGVTQTYVSQIVDGFGYTSANSNWNYLFGVPETVTDINGNNSTYRYDDVGRLIRFDGPLGEGADLVYNTSVFPISATTDRDDIDSGILSSRVFADGWGRTLQTVGDAEVNGQVRTVYGGVPVIDELGRLTDTQYPVVGSSLNYQATYNNPTTMTYDLLDRKLIETLPGGRVFENQYSNIGLDLSITIIDANLNSSSKKMEYNGPVLEQVSNLGFITSFDYDDIDQLDFVTHPNGLISNYNFDIGGRLDDKTSPDMGFTDYEYDALGNITSKQNEWEVNYTYSLGRIDRIEYPALPISDVTYFYDGPAQNGLGRLWRQMDESGTHQFSYDALGNVITSERSFAIPFKTKSADFKSEWVYDTWSRVRTMTYPDGEMLKYTYDSGGNLDKIVGDKSGHTYKYLTNMEYDEFGARTRVKYGNGVESTHTYRADERWPSTSICQFVEGNSITRYEQYDRMGNLNNVSYDSDKWNETTDRPYRRGSQSYRYDEDYRIRTSSGDWIGTRFECENQNRTASYSNSYDYDEMGNFKSKTSTTSRKDEYYEKGYSKTYSFDYETLGGSNKIAKISERYQDSDQFNSIQRESTHKYGYTSNGNINSVGQNIYDTNNAGAQQQYRTQRGILWQPEDRMRALADDNVVTHFVYDGDGERVLKLSETYHKIFTNSEDSAYPVSPMYYTLYVSPYMVVRPDGHYTKHIYAGSERITSKIGNPKDYGVDPSSLSLGLPNDKKEPLEGLIIENYIKLENKLVIKHDYGADPVMGFLDGDTEYERLQYYFYKDHLGSSSFVSDVRGLPTHHIEYMPFGESYVDMRFSSWATPYKFNAKEQDCETGLHYYGARYYDARVGRFMSVDDVADKYPSFNPYNFTFNNPILYVDPDGNENIPALLWAQKNMANKGIKFDTWYGSGPDQGGWTYKRGVIPSKTVCYESCWTSYMNGADKQTMDIFKSGFTNKNGAFYGRSTDSGGMNWFKAGDGTDRAFVDDITKGELGDIVFMGEVGDMKGHAVLLASGIDKGISKVGGKEYETMSFSSLSTGANGQFGDRDFTFYKVDGEWNLSTDGSGYDFKGYGQMRNIHPTKQQCDEIDKIFNK